jgi:hypothetical protein
MRGGAQDKPERVAGELRCRACGEVIVEHERGWYALEDGTLTNTRSDSPMHAWHARCLVPSSLR